MTSTTPSLFPNAIVVAMVPCVADEALLLYTTRLKNHTRMRPMSTIISHGIAKRLFTNTVNFNLGIHYSEKR